MSGVGEFFWGGMAATARPVLPAPWLMEFALGLGWGVVIAGLAVWMLRCRLRNRWLKAGLVVGLLLWAGVPGVWSPSYWLGLAFQQPSLIAVLLCATYVVRSFSAIFSTDPTTAHTRTTWLLMGLGWGLGWVLFLDTLALLPIEVYAWGFNPLASLLLVFVTGLLWGVCRAGTYSFNPVWSIFGALLLFAALRLPSGNVWDAVLDPWLWLVLNVVLLRKLIAWAKLHRVHFLLKLLRR
jgi:hypothetical protein